MHVRVFNDTQNLTFSERKLRTTNWQFNSLGTIMRSFCFNISTRALKHEGGAMLIRKFENPKFDVEIFYQKIDFTL